MHAAFLGLGLIGGSIARAIRPAGWTAAAWTPEGRGPRQAMAAGAIDVAAADLGACLADADLVVLAAPPTRCLDLLDTLAGEARGRLPADAVVTDVASTKAMLVARAAQVAVRFVGGHPMAGREVSGFDAADASLFVGRPWVIVAALEDDESPDAAAVARVEALARACGAVPLRMGARAHDAAVAGISHLPLLVSAALVEAVAGDGEEPREGWPAAAALAATGWGGATRLARGDDRMAAGIAATNAAPLAARVRDLRDSLEDWLAILESAPAGRPADEEALRARFAAARARLETA